MNINMNKDNHRMSAADMMRASLMSMFMLGNAGNIKDGLNSDDQMVKWMYRIVALTVVEKVVYYTPVVLSKIGSAVQSYLENKGKKMIEAAVSTPEREIKSRISFHAHMKESDIICNAVIDYITNLPNILNITYKNRNYLLNHNKPVCIDDQNEIYVQLLNTTTNITVSDQPTADTVQVVEIYSYVFDVYELRKFIDQIIVKYNIKIQNKLGANKYYFNALPSPTFKTMDGEKDYSKCLPHLVFTMKNFTTNRKFSNVIGPESRSIQKRVDFFRNNKKWYDDKGVPYTLGLLLSGPPGGGKTSTIKCVANELKRHIINVKLSDEMTKQQLENLFFSDIIHVLHNGKTEQLSIPIDNRVYVFEDVDCQDSTVIMERSLIADSPTYSNTIIQENPEQDFGDILREFKIGKLSEDMVKLTIKSKINQAIQMSKSTKSIGNVVGGKKEDELITLSCLLNTFDGILETPGRVIIMTSNYPGKLDKALIRPGRIDIMCEFRRCDHGMIIEFMEKFYDITLTSEETDAIKSVHAEKYTPAEMMKIMFENFDSHRSAISSLL